MKIIPILLLSIVCAMPDRAEDWTVNGKTYHNVTVTKVEPDRVHVIYNGGLGTLSLAELGPQAQKKFGYDPKLAAIAISERSNAAALTEASIVQANKQAAIINAQKTAEYAAEDARASAYNKSVNDNADRQMQVAVAQDRLPGLKDDLAYVMKHVVVNKTGVHGDKFYTDKYAQDQAGIAECNRIIKSGGKSQ